MLKVHFRSELYCDNLSIDKAAEESLNELDAFKHFVQNQISAKEVCLEQVNKYQNDIQILQQNILQSEQDLRHLITSRLTGQDIPNLKDKQKVSYF